MDRSTVQECVACVLSKHGCTALERLKELEVDRAESGDVGKVGYRKQKSDGTSTRVALRVGKFVRQFFGDGMDDQTIQNIGAEITALLWSGTENDPSGVKELEGEDLRRFYRYSVSGITSCMAHDDAQQFLDIYVDNPDRVKLATVRINGCAARALVWTFPNGNRYMDRIYCTSDVCRVALDNYAKQQGIGCRDDIPSTRMPMKIRYGEDSKWPFVDTLHYANILSQDKCELSASHGDYCLQTTDGCLEGHGYDCYRCGDHLGEDEVLCSDYDGNDYCEECYNELFFYCCECRNEQDLSNSVVTASGESVCQRCYERCYFICEDCEEVFHGDAANAVEDGDRTVCNSCYENNYFTCKECGEEHYVQHQHSGPDDFEYCEECWREKFALCKKCGKSFAKNAMVDDACSDCATDELIAVSTAPAEEVETHA